MTLFPEMIKSALETSITGKAIDKNLISLDLVNIRDYANNKHKKVDDYPYGGGAGMVMQPEPIYNAYNSIIEKMSDKKPKVIYLTPQGTTFNQKMAEDFSKEESLVLLCGHYEGIDERILNTIVTDYVSIGDYVLTGGELAAMVVVDAISRLVPGVLKNDESSVDESFQDNLLEYPQYTRPPVFIDQSVPQVLTSGHHGKISEWRRLQSLKRTHERRPDLLNKAELTEDEKKYINSLEK